MRKHKGFTLVEILIVVVILGILAAIVIPQFSDASTQSKLSSSQSSLQSLRSQISLYKIQHNDYPPCHGTFSEATFVAQMEGKTNAAGNTSTTDGPVIYGPYVQKIPMNPWNNSRTIAATDGADVGWVYEADTGAIYLGSADVPTTGDTKTTLINAGAILAP